MSTESDMQELESAVKEAVDNNDHRLACWLDELFLARYGRQTKVYVEKTDRRVTRRLGTPEAREFWRRVDESSREVETWSKWKRSLSRIAIDGNR